MDQRSPSSSPWSSQRWNNDHSNQVEHRITVLEISDEGQRLFNAKVKKRLWWIEKALQTMAGILYMLINGKAHDWAPSVADLLIRLIRMGP